MESHEKVSDSGEIVSFLSLMALPCVSLQDIQHLSPATDFYKKLALDCSGQQVAVDLFLLSTQYCDLASLGKSRAKQRGRVYWIVFAYFHV